MDETIDRVTVNDETYRIDFRGLANVPITVPCEEERYTLADGTYTFIEEVK